MRYARTTYDITCDHPAGCGVELPDVDGGTDVAAVHGWQVLESVDSVELHLCPLHRLEAGTGTLGGWELEVPGE